MKLLLFDVDGTLVDSQAIIHECMRQTFVDFNFAEPSLEQSKSIIGLSLSLAIATIMEVDESAETVEMAEHYKRVYLGIQHMPEFKSNLFDGVTEMVHGLHQEPRNLLGLVTGKAQRGVDHLLDTYDFRPHFTTTRCADDCPSKPHPALVEECCSDVGVHPSQAVVIGDTSFDIQMAKSAGASAIGVSWGNHELEKLEKAGADHLVHSMDELHSLLKQIEVETAA